MDDAVLGIPAGHRLTSKPFDPEAFVDAAAPLLGLTLTEESRVEILFNLRVAAAQAELLLSAELPELKEPAPVFRP
jgi:hypothetical protein